jgi:hypothetical protein
MSAQCTSSSGDDGYHARPLWNCPTWGDGPNVSNERDCCALEAAPLYKNTHFYGGNDVASQHYGLVEPGVEEAKPSWFPYAGSTRLVVFSVIGTVAALDVGEYVCATIAPRHVFQYTSSQASRHSRAAVPTSCARHTAVSAIAFTVAATTIHHHFRDDQYQDSFLFAGMTLGIGIGLCLGKGLEGTIFKVLPCAILVALLCSMVLHRVLGRTKSCAMDGQIHCDNCKDVEKCGMDEH